MWSMRLSRQGKGDNSHGEEPRPGMLAVVGDDCDETAVTAFANAEAWDLQVAHTVSQILRAPTKANTAVVLIDADLAGGDWRDTIRLFVQQRPIPCVVLACAATDESLFEEVVKQGGFDIVAKPLRLEELRRVGRLALTFWKNRAAHGLR